MTEKVPVMNITPLEFGRRFRKALSIPFDFNQACSTNINQFVTSYATALGCSEKVVLLPLLSCVAACMGTESYLDLLNLWHEPPIIWTLVITPRSLLRIDVAEHFKQELLSVQNELWHQNEDEEKEHIKKFIFDMLTLDQLQMLLRLNNGHGFGIYNSIRSLHKCMITPEQSDIMQRLHQGLAVFSDSRVTKSTLSKTRVNIAVISTPSVVQKTLTSAPNFQELFYQCFLTACAEERPVKFNQLTEMPETEKLREIFQSLMKLHSAGPVVYKLNQEGNEKFIQVHDELTDKAKQMCRKNMEYNIYQPALNYLGRLSCLLHVVDNALESINYKVPISHLTWNTEINATSVSYARELLYHIIEQRIALLEPTTIGAIPSSHAAINLVEDQGSPRSRIQRTPQALQRTPQALQRTPQGLQRTQQGFQRTPQGIQRAPQGLQRSPQGLQRSPQGLRSPQALRSPQGRTLQARQN